MLVRLLGPVQTDGASPLSGLRRRAVLAILALHLGEMVSLDRIIDTVWGDQPPSGAANAVQAHVSHLRRYLGAADAIVTRPPGYLMPTTVMSTDVGEAERLLGEARRETDPLRAEALLADAVQLWRGPSLADVRAIDLLRSHAQRLDGLRLVAFQAWVDRRLELGQHAALVPELERWSRDNPLHEQLHERLIIALYRCGRQADGLAVCRSLRSRLDDELGVAPSQTLRDLETAVLRQDPYLDAPVHSPVPSPGRITQLGPARPVLLEPGQPNPTPRETGRAAELIGREAELAQLETALARSRLVTITGPGGAGKTHLAMVALDRSTERDTETGVALADLSTAQSDQIADRVIDAIGLARAPQSTPVQTLRNGLSDRKLLLMLDNCEHVLDAVAELVNELLAAARGLRILATSRAALGVTEQLCLPLAPLDVPDDDTTDVREVSAAPAVALLVHRATQADPSFAVTATNAAAVGRLCRTLDGLPLALELAAPRLRAMSPTELVDALEEGVPILDDVGIAAPPRHRSLQAAVAWSYQLLSDSQRRTFRRIAAFRGGARPDDIAVVCFPASRATVLPDLAHLVDASMLTRTPDGEFSRLHLHEILRRFAVDELARAGETDDVLRAHAELFRTRASQDGNPRTPATTNRTGLHRLRRDNANLEGALAWATEHDIDLAVQLGAALWWYWFRDGRPAAGRQVLERILTHPDAERSPAVNAARAGAGYLAWLEDDYPSARTDAETVLARPDAAPATVALAHGVLARALGDAGEHAQAADHAARSVALYAHIGDTWGAAWSQRCQASALVLGGRLEEGRNLARRSLEQFEALDDLWGAAGALDQLSGVERRLGNLAQAQRLAQDAVQRHRALGDSSGERYSLQHLADAARAAGDHELAVQTARESLALARAHGYRVGALQALLLLSEVLGDREAAEEAGTLARQLGDAGSAERATRAGQLPAVPPTRTASPG